MYMVYIVIGYAVLGRGEGAQGFPVTITAHLPFLSDTTTAFLRMGGYWS